MQENRAVIENFGHATEQHKPFVEPRAEMRSELNHLSSLATEAPKKKALSKREIDVLELVKDGMKNPEIASQLNLSTKTVENHVRNILLKLGVKNRTQAVVFGLKNQLILF